MYIDCFGLLLACIGSQDVFIAIGLYWITGCFGCVCAGSTECMYMCKSDFCLSVHIRRLGPNIRGA